jgi:membrane fusion protein, copper/silver efflux system
MTILAPRSGVITKKNVVEGQIVPEGSVLFEVADLSHVWIKAQIYEDQAGMVEPGQGVEATVEAYPGEMFPGRLAFIDPELDPNTRTLGVRFDMDNANHRLRPGMYATVILRIPLTETPAFKTRVVRAPEHTTHTRLTAAEQKTCPVTGLRLGTMGDPVLAEAHGHSVWTCCPACPPKFRAKPEKYLARLAPAPRDQVLTIPAAAVIDTGRRQVVYVETEPGVFEGREVVLGPRSGDRYPVLEGLSPGEAVAAEGAFLIDAETRLNPAAGTVYFGSQGGAPAPAHAVH